MSFRKVEKSQTLSFNEISKELLRAGKKVYRFGFGESPFFPPTRVQEALQESAHRQDYTPVLGIPELREAVAKFHTKVDGVPTESKQVIVGSGSKILLFNSLMAFEDAVVFIPSPSWVSYAPQASIIGHETRLIPTTFESRWHVEPALLDEMLSAPDIADQDKILVLNYPGNPDGLTYSPDELQALTAVLRKHGAWAISDEIYGMLHHQGKHVSLRSYYPERTLVTTGLSKWGGAGGWRLGVQIIPADAPEGLRDALHGVASETYSCAPVPIQVAATQAYAWDDETATFLKRQQRILRLLGQQMHQRVVDAKIKAHPPEGAFYLMLDFTDFREALQARGIETDRQLCEQVLSETGAAILPGSAFRMEPSALTARLAYVDFKGTELLKKIDSLSDEQLNDVLLEHCAHMFEGLERLKSWLPN